MREVENYKGGNPQRKKKKPRGNIHIQSDRIISVLLLVHRLAGFFFFFLNRIMEDEKETLTSAFKSDVSNFALRLLPRGGVKMFLVN